MKRSLFIRIHPSFPASFASVGNLLALFLFCLPCLTFGQSSKQDSALILEMSPLKGAMGQVSSRVEYKNAKAQAVHILYEDIMQKSERENMQDRHTTTELGYDWYPVKGEYMSGLFVGAGLSYEKAIVGHALARSYKPGTTLDRAHRFNAWTENRQSALFDQTIGYRYNMTHFLTSSLRLNVSEVMYSKQTLTDTELHADASDEDTHPPTKRVKVGLALFMGLSF